MAGYRRVYDSHHLQADWDQLRNPTLGNRAWASFTFSVSVCLSVTNRYCTETTGRIELVSGTEALLHLSHNVISKFGYLQIPGQFSLELRPKLRT